MSILTTFPFDNTANYAKIKTEVSGGAGRFNLIANAALLFNQAFAASAGFTFNALLAEFVGGKVQQKDQVAAFGDGNSVLGATLTINGDLNYGDAADKTISLNNGAVVAGGELDLSANDGGPSFGAYNGTDLTDDVTTVGSFFVEVVPLTSGAPAIQQQYFNSRNTGNQNSVGLTYRTDGQMRLTLTSSTGATIHGANLGAHVAVGGVAERWLILLDLTPAAESTKVFLNGVQFGATINAAGVRSNLQNQILFGDAVGNQNFKVLQFAIFNTVQTDLDFGPAQPVPEAKFVVSKVDLPDSLYTLPGLIQSLDGFATTEIGTPQFTIEGQYWDGGAWATSDGTPAQSNSKATVIANIAALDVLGQSAISVSIVFLQSDTQSSVDDLTLTYTGQKYEIEGTLLTSAGFVAQLISLFIATEIKPANTNIKYAMNVNGSNFYHDTNLWVSSDGTNAQANTLAEIQANIATLLTVNSTIKILIILTGDSLATPEIDLLSITYDFGALDPTAPIKAQVFAYLRDSEDKPIVNAAVSVVPNRGAKEYVEAADRIIALKSVKQTDANGFFSFNLMISSEFEVGGAQAMQYVLTITPDQGTAITDNGDDGGSPAIPKTILFEVPNLPTVNLTAQIGAI